MPTLKMRVPFLASLLFVVALAASTESAALAQRTFVASYGLDTNPCTVVSPCRSFATAISNALAGGEVIVLDSAGYGPVTITQSVSITAPSGVYAGIFAPGVFGVTVNGTGVIVALRGLTMNGLGGGVGGIDFKQGQRLDIENCIISGFGNAGILLEAPSSFTYISDTTVRYSAPGIEITDGEVTIDRVHIENNANGGLRIQTASSTPIIVAVRDSVASQNGQAGFIVTSNATQTARLLVERSLATRSTNGFVAGGQGNSTMIIRDSSAVENTQSGILADAGFSTVVAVVSGSTSSRNGTYGLEQSASAVLRTLQNNTLELNTIGAKFGVVTNASLL